jgi:hypothetical protein
VPLRFSNYRSNANLPNPNPPLPSVNSSISKRDPENTWPALGWRDVAFYRQDHAQKNSYIAVVIEPNFIAL